MKEKELVDKLYLAVATFNITAIGNPNMIILRNDLKVILDLCLKQKKVIDKINLIVKGIAYGGNEDYYIEKVNEINKLLNEVSI